MTRSLVSSAGDLMAPYRLPDPKTVARIIDGYGSAAAIERWGYLSADTITRLAQQGRQMIAAERRTS